MGSTNMLPQETKSLLVIPEKKSSGSVIIWVPDLNPSPFSIAVDRWPMIHFLKTFWEVILDWCSSSFWLIFCFVCTGASSKIEIKAFILISFSCLPMILIFQLPIFDYCRWVRFSVSYEPEGQLKTKANLLCCTSWVRNDISFAIGLFLSH